MALIAKDFFFNNLHDILRCITEIDDMGCPWHEPLSSCNFLLAEILLFEFSLDCLIIAYSQYVFVGIL